MLAVLKNMTKTLEQTIKIKPEVKSHFQVNKNKSNFGKDLNESNFPVADSTWPTIGCTYFKIYLNLDKVPMERLEVP